MVQWHIPAMAGVFDYLTKQGRRGGNGDDAVQLEAQQAAENLQKQANALLGMEVRACIFVYVYIADSSMSLFVTLQPKCAILYDLMKCQTI
jgi:hypothetical protein